MADTETECESFFQDKINSMLVTTSWVDDLKSLLGIEAVSQIWGSKPAWYMWFSDVQGAYRLQLSDAMNAENNPANKQCFFSIKCYPFHNSDVFDLFSYEEQSLCQSRFFDETHTPRFEEGERIPESLFNVAAMEYQVNHDDTVACFSLETLDTLRCVYPKETVQHFDLLGKSRRYREGEIGRSVPGWQLGYPVFDRLLSMYAFYSKTKPVRVRITRSRGFHYLHTRNHSFDCLDTPDTQLLTASVLFSSPLNHGPGSHSNQVDFLVPEEDPDQAEILLDHEFPCGHFYHSEKMASFHRDQCTPINPLWWSLSETVYKSTLASTCGCH